MDNKEKNFASAVIYVHNAENRIENFLNTIISVMEDNFEHSEIICINDSSDDNSLSKIKEASNRAERTSVSVVNMGYFHGLEIAMNAGIDLTIGDFVFEFDNTILDYNKSEIMKVYHKSLQGYDIVNASPDRKNKFTSNLFYKVLNKFTDLSYLIQTESFRILSRRAINRISSMNKTTPYRKVIYARSGLKAATINYKAIDDLKIQTDKKEKHYRFGLAVDSLILFTNVGYTFSITMTILMMFISTFMVVYSIMIYITAHPVAGWTTTILFLSIAMFGLFGILTIIIKNLQLIVNFIFKRKHYSFESIEKLTK